MTISIFSQPSVQSPVGNFKLAKSSKDSSATHQSHVKTISSDDVVEQSKNISQDNIKFQLEKVMNESSQYLQDGLGKIFDRGEALLAGKTSADYNKHIKELSKAIQGQDYKNAEKLVDQFYNGDTEKIINRVQSLASSVEEKFWNDAEKALSFLDKNETKWQMMVDGEMRDDLSTFDLAKMALQTSKEEIDSFSSRDFSETVISARKTAIAHAKTKLSNAGQNRYNEDSASVTSAATELAKEQIFGTNKDSYDEDTKKLSDIRKLKGNDTITQEQIDRLTHQNTRKTDTFTKYMRGRADKFEEEFEKLKLAASPIGQETTSQNAPEETEVKISDISFAVQPPAQLAQNQLKSPELTDILTANKDKSASTHKNGAEIYGSAEFQNLLPYLDQKI